MIKLLLNVSFCDVIRLFYSLCNFNRERIEDRNYWLLIIGEQVAQVEVLIVISG